MFLGMIMVLLRGNVPLQITLSENLIRAPKGFLTGSMVSIPYADITSMKIVEYHKNFSLRIHHKQGMLCIYESALPNRQTFQDLTKELALRLKTHQTRNGISTYNADKSPVS